MKSNANLIAFAAKYHVTPRQLVFLSQRFWEGAWPSDGLGNVVFPGGAIGPKLGTAQALGAMAALRTGGTTDLPFCPDAHMLLQRAEDSSILACTVRLHTTDEDGDPVFYVYSPAKQTA